MVGGTIKPEFKGYENSVLIEVTDKEKALYLFNSNDEYCWCAGNSMDDAGWYAELSAIPAHNGKPLQVTYCAVSIMFD